MSQFAEPTAESTPNCPKCGQAMVRRVARRGANAGSEFWGCSEFPRCRGIVSFQPPGDAPVRRDTSVEQPGTPDSAAGTTAPDGTGNGETLLTKVWRTADRVRRWYLELAVPDATGRWDDADRRGILRYLHDRDGGRCGLCAGEMKLKGAQIEHVVPKVFAVFDVTEGGKAEPGTRYKSRLHKLDNLQAAHTYCNKPKGNTPDIAKWRHPAMPPLTVADAENAQPLVLPLKPSAGSAR